jgi:lipid-binding SYLF domain-containing protein
MRKLLLTILTVAAMGWVTANAAWDPDEGAEYDAKAQVALTAFREADPKIESFIAKSAGYVVIPTVGKGGIGIGGARGKGVLYEGGAVSLHCRS